MPPQPQLTTARTRIRLLRVDDAGRLLDYRRRNREHLAPWEPAREPVYYSLEDCVRYIAARTAAARADSGYSLLGLDPDEARILATLNFSNLVRGAFQACHLGYSVDAAAQGRGLMSESLRAALDWAFRDLGLHRVMANYMPENRRSERLLQSLGFRREGHARSYLCINGQWRDHVLTSLLHPDARD